MILSYVAQVSELLCVLAGVLNDAGNQTENPPLPHDKVGVVEQSDSNANGNRRLATQPPRGISTTYKREASRQASRLLDTSCILLSLLRKVEFERASCAPAGSRNRHVSVQHVRFRTMNAVRRSAEATVTEHATRPEYRTSIVTH